MKASLVKIFTLPLEPTSLNRMPTRFAMSTLSPRSLCNLDAVLRQRDIRKLHQCVSDKHSPDIGCLYTYCAPEAIFSALLSGHSSLHHQYLKQACICSSPLMHHQISPARYRCKSISRRRLTP